jgi:chaperonin GroES
LYDRVLVKRLESEQKTAGGLFIPEAAKEKPQQAEVIAIGTGRLTEKNEIVPLTVKKGDRVLFGKYAGDEVKLDGVEHIILRESDILAILD